MSRINYDKIKTDSIGRWLSILRALGVSIREDGRHCKCPVCGRDGKWRYTDRDGSGDSICTCGSYDGFALVQEVLQVDFKGACEAVNEVIGGCEKNAIPKEKPLPTIESLRDMIRGGQPYRKGDIVDLYLSGRGITARPTQQVWSHPALWESETRSNQKAMCCLFSMPSSDVVCFHRTYLTAEGEKMDIQAPKKITPATVKNITGGSVRLFDVDEVKTMGIAEGIETALAAAQDFKLPFWAATTAVLLERWVPPKHIEHVIIVGDNDRSFTGQSAAYSLAKNLTLKYKKEVSVFLPDKPGADWLDVVIDQDKFKAQVDCLKN